MGKIRKIKSEGCYLLSLLSSPPTPAAPLLHLRAASGLSFFIGSQTIGIGKYISQHLLELLHFIMALTRGETSYDYVINLIKVPR